MARKPTTTPTKAKPAPRRRPAVKANGKGAPTRGATAAPKTASRVEVDLGINAGAAKAGIESLLGTLFKAGSDRSTALVRPKSEEVELSARLTMLSDLVLTAALCHAGMAQSTDGRGRIFVTVDDGHPDEERPMLRLRPELLLHAIEHEIQDHLAWVVPRLAAQQLPSGSV